MVGGEAKFVDYVTQVEDLLATNLAFWRFEFKFGAEDTSKYGAELVQMLGDATNN